MWDILYEEELPFMTDLVIANMVKVDIAWFPGRIRKSLCLCKHYCCWLLVPVFVFGLSEKQDMWLIPRNSDCLISWLIDQFGCRCYLLRTLINFIQNTHEKHYLAHRFDWSDTLLRVFKFNPNDNRKPALGVLWSCQDHRTPSTGLGLSLQWRHNEYDGVSNHQRQDCLLNCLLRRRSK